MPPFIDLVGLSHQDHVWFRTKWQQQSPSSQSLKLGNLLGHHKAWHKPTMGEQPAMPLTEPSPFSLLE